MNNKAKHKCQRSLQLTRKPQETGFSKDTKFKKWQFHPTVQEKTQRHCLNPTVDAHEKAQR